jgi:hypothetical protein
MRNKLAIGLAVLGLVTLALAVMAVIPIMAQSILPILPPPGHCWAPTPPPGWHGKPFPILPQIIICNFPIHGQPIILPPYPPHPIPLKSIGLIVTAPPQPPGGCNSLYCWTNQ